MTENDDRRARMDRALELMAAFTAPRDPDRLNPWTTLRLEDETLAQLDPDNDTDLASTPHCMHGSPTTDCPLCNPRPSDHL